MATGFSGSSWRYVAVSAALSGGALGLAHQGPDTRQEVFRAGVDLIAVDVQVSDPDGVPIDGLGPERFEVRIGGRVRQVVSAQLVRDVRAGTTTTSAPAGSNVWPVDGPARTFVVAIDTPSFAPGDVPSVMRAIRRFINQLPGHTHIGLVSLPTGVRVAPTTDRVNLQRTLERVIGQKQSVASSFNLNLVEVVDITSQAGNIRTQAMGRVRGAPLPPGQSNDTIRSVQRRECEGDPECVNYLLADAEMLAQQMELDISRSLSGLSALLGLLGEYPGRKTVVVVSAGMPVSDRPGGRPEAPDSVRMFGEQAARSNATVYALHVDRQMRTNAGAQSRVVPLEGGARRERHMQSKLLADFAAPSGGTMFTAVADDGERAFQRVVTETSAYYLLGVEPAGVDRNGRPQELRVRVDAKDSTVRARSWVVVPPRRQ